MSLITWGDAAIRSHSHSGGVAVGGSLVDRIPSESKTFQGASWIVGSMSCPRCLWQGPLHRGGTLPYQWSQFEYVAKHAVPSSGVVVIDQQNSTIDLDNRIVERHGTTFRGDNHLVVLRGTGTIKLRSTVDGRQFSSSLLAPFAKVVVYDNVGYIDGVVIALEYTARGEGGGGLQLHGNRFLGRLVCEPAAAATFEDMGTAADTWPRRKCYRKLRKRKCAEVRVREVCAHTCTLS